MKHQYHIQYHSPAKKIKVLVFTCMVLAICLVVTVMYYGYLFTLIKTTPALLGTFTHLKSNIMNTTPIGLFYEHFIGGIFFVPSADELVFYYALGHGNAILLSLCTSLAGYMLAQILNYIIGLKISNFMLHLVSKKKVYKTKRWVNKYGVYGIFFFNFIPILPAPLLIFALGVTKYNFKRLFITTLLAKTLEYLAIVGIFLLISKQFI